jgi:hypothetical protein
MQSTVASGGVRSSLKATWAAISIVALLLVLSAAAEADEATRATYKQAADPICLANTQANERILAGVRGEVKQGRLGTAARRFERAAEALRSTLAELRQIPRPAADGARLSRWFGFIAAEEDLLERTGDYLAAGQKGAAAGMVVRLKSVAGRANNVVFAFEFEYCRFDPTRFT